MLVKEREQLMQAAWRAYWMRRQGKMPCGCIINTFGRDAFLRAIRPFIDSYVQTTRKVPTAIEVLGHLAEQQDRRNRTES